MLASQPEKRKAPQRGGRSRITSLCLASIVEESEDAMICADLDGAILIWNRGAAAVFGYTADEMLSRSMASLAPLDRVPEEKDILEKIRAGQRIQNLETVRRRKGDVLLDVSLTVSPVRDGAQVVGAAYVARDISERKRLEAAKAQLTAVVESSEDAMISADFEGQIKTWNASAERVFGFPAQEAIGRNIRWLVPAERLAEESAILDAVRNGERIDHFETLRTRHGGVHIPVSLTIVPVRDRRGGLSGVLYIAREIIEKR